MEKIAQEVDEIVIVIGSAQESHTLENPFTGGERMEMIYAALSESGLRERSVVTPLQDINRNSIWVSHLRSMVPRFDVVYSNNPLVVQLFDEAGIQIRRSPMYQREQYSGTAIRKLMRENGEWSGLVPACVAAFIKEIGGVGRLVSMSKSDRSLPNDIH